MRIGNLEAILQPSKPNYLYMKYFGLPHYGSHVRFDKIKHLFASGGGKRVLDLGCGNGSYLNYLGYIHDFSGVGVDRLENVIDVANRVNSYYSLGNKFIVSDIDRYLSSNEDQKFDYILCIDVLEHIDNPGEVIKNCIRQLIPGGQLIISTPTLPKKHWLFNSGNIDFGYGYDKHVVDGYSEGELLRSIDTAQGKTVKRIETFKKFGQIFWEISEKMRGKNALYRFFVPLFFFLSKLDDLLSQKNTNSGIILVVERNA